MIYARFHFANIESRSLMHICHKPRLLNTLPPCAFRNALGYTSVSFKADERMWLITGLKVRYSWLIIYVRISGWWFSYHCPLACITNQCPFAKKCTYLHIFAIVSIYSVRHTWYHTCIHTNISNFFVWLVEHFEMHVTPYGRGLTFFYTMMLGWERGMHLHYTLPNNNF